MAMEMFSTEYSFVQKQLKKAKFHGKNKTLLNDLKIALTDRGFNLMSGPKLDLLRKRLGDHQAHRIMRAVGINPGSNSAPDLDKLRFATAIKFLRHTYLVGERGAQKVWVHSVPRKYKKWVTDEIWDSYSNMAELKEKLNNKKERFSATQRRRLGEATVNGVRHCSAAKLNALLAYVDTDGKEMDKVKRWFGDASTTTAQLESACLKLYSGFGKVWNTLNSNLVVFTDMPTLRGAASGTDDYGFLEAYAFVYSGRYEKIPIIYIENAFFGKNSTPIGQKTLWALTVVHETTHLDISTKDHRYDYDGLKPDGTLTHAKAIDNADSWAYYAADCAGELTNSMVTKALNGW